MIVVTTDKIERCIATNYLGIVTATDDDYAADFNSAKLLNKLQEKARGLGANAIIGLRFFQAKKSKLDRWKAPYFMVAYGTAVKVELKEEQEKE